MPRSIFCRIEPPDNLAHLAINRFATWHTWSDAFRAFLVHAGDELRRFPSPPTVRIKRLSNYDYTFSLPPTLWKDASLHKQFETFVQSLAKVRPTKRLMFFDRLLGAHLDGQGLHVLFAIIRGALAKSATNDFAAMYTPLGDTGDAVGDFLLHADLYVPQYLFNVFDNVSADYGGASTFLAVSSLKRIVARQPKLPWTVARRLISMFEKESKSDRFDKCFDLLHGEHQWVPKLEQSLAEHQMQIPLRAGQGYLLHDRSWLHGRLKPVGGVPANRVRRLIYG
jgi:hypothetical protein